VLGNLLSRVDALQVITETFGYDTLDRLLSVTGPASKSFQYDAIGNLTYKSDVGNYAYTAGKAHAVSAAGSNTYTYDLNGNQLTGPGRSVAYTTFNKPSSIVKDGLATALTYDAGFNRVKKSNVNGATVYVGKLYERVVTGTLIEHKHYLSAGGAPVAVYTQRNSGASDTRYLHTDHLGSVDTITDEAGNVAQRFSYDAHGKRRNPNWTDAASPIVAPFPRGFTGHEMDDESGLINMNAREYDPVLGRFLSPDTIVQAAFGQALNRYSYVHNNPLSYTDPTGRFSLRDFVAIVSPGTAALVYVNDHKDDIARGARNVLQKVSEIRYVGGLLSIGLLTDLQFGLAYGWSTGDWKSVGRAHVAGAVMAASYGAGAAAWAVYTPGSLLSAVGFILDSAVIGYASSYTIAKIYGASEDEARAAGKGGARSAAAMAALRIGLEYMRGVTDSRAEAAAETRGHSDVPTDHAGRTWTYGVRGCDFDCSSLFADVRMPYETDSLYSFPFAGCSLCQDIGNAISKVHDFLSDFSYSNVTGQTWVQGYYMNTMLDFYSFATMPIAGAYVIQAYGGFYLYLNDQIVQGR